MSRTPHCTRYCRQRGYGKHPGEWIHYHATAKRKRFVRGHYPKPPSDGMGGRVADTEGQHGRVRARVRDALRKREW